MDGVAGELRAFLWALERHDTRMYGEMGFTVHTAAVQAEGIQGKHVLLLHLDY